MIIFHEGLPGSGKSYEAVVKHIIPALIKGRQVCGYIDGLDHEKISGLVGVDRSVIDRLLISISRDDVPRIYELAPDNSLVIIDELQNFWPSCKTRIDGPITQFVTEHRHRGIDILAMGQDLRDCHALWKRRVDQKVTFMKLDMLGASSRYKWTVFKALSGERFEKISTGVQEYETKYFGTYKSYVSADTNTTQYNDNRAIFWKNKLFLIGLAFVLCVFVLSPMYLKKVFSVDDSPLVHKSTTSPAQQQTKQVQVPAPVKQVVTSTSTPELVNPEFDYIADLAKSNRIRLVSVLQFSNKTFVVIEFRDSSFRVIDRLDSKMLDSLGWSVDVVSTQLVRVKKGNGQNFVATAWPLESVGRVSEQQNFSIRQSSTGIVTDVR